MAGGAIAGRLRIGIHIVADIRLYRARDQREFVMHDVDRDCRDPAELLRRDRAVARRRSRGLRSRSSELDRLAHLDPLVADAQPPRPDARARDADRPARAPRRRRRRCCSSISTGSRCSTTASATKAGDAALIQVARNCSPGCAPSDCVARLGGDEFGILLDHADEASALRDRERLVDHDRRRRFPASTAQPMPLSVAIGVTHDRARRHAERRSSPAPTRRCTG